MKYYLLKFLSYLNICISRFHESKKLNDFLESIKIYDCGHDLIRYGEKNDGGYLVPNIMDDVKYLFSAGVGITTKFEDDIVSKHNTKNYFIDYSVNLDLKKYNFIKKKVDYFNDDNSTTLQNWINNCLEDEGDVNCSDLMLSLDIEGYEIESFLTMNDNLLKKFKIIVVEFHDFGALKNHVGLKIYEIIFKKLLKYFYICHIHPVNNCQKYNFKGKVIPNVMEFTFINKLSAKHAKKVSYNMPHKNDSISNTSYKEIVLPGHFYK